MVKNESNVEREMRMNDEWSGLAYLLANLIEKHATELSLDDEALSNDFNHDNNIYEYKSLNIKPCKCQ